MRSSTDAVRLVTIRTLSPAGEGLKRFEPQPFLSAGRGAAGAWIVGPLGVRFPAGLGQRNRAITMLSRLQVGSDSSRTSRRTKCVVLLVLAIQSSAFARIDKLGKPEGAVDILAWPSYIERGETDKAFDWVTDFETKSGCKVNVKTATNSDEMLAAMSDGSFDLVVASGDASLRLIGGALVQEINTALVPSYKTIDPRLQKATWHYVNGKNYGVPYQWGATVLAYNSSVFKTPPKSWDVVFAAMQLPDGKPNQGRVEAFDAPLSIADAALYLMAT